MSTLQYPGEELDLFANARNWKGYWASQIRSFLRGDVLEVGAGIGSNMRLLSANSANSWTCLEPDSSLAERLREGISQQSGNCSAVTGLIGDFEPRPRFDCILYIDVLEHIPDDAAELKRATRLLRAHGHLIVLSPAYQWLYSPFDQSIGHCRRYSASTLRRCKPEGCTLERLAYLDCGGIATSLANRLFLKQSMPQLRQILFWDRFVVPVSKLLDPLVFHSFGKSILAVWKKDE